MVLTSNRGLAGGYNSGVLRAAIEHLQRTEGQGITTDVHMVGKKGINYFNYQKRPLAGKSEAKDVPTFDAVNRAVEPLIRRFVDGELDAVNRAIDPLVRRFVDGEIDAVHVAYMNFISTGVQRPEVLTILPLAGLKESLERIAHQVAEKEAQVKAGALDAVRRGEDVRVEDQPLQAEVVYDFSPSMAELLDELLPMTVKTTFFQTFLDATTSEHVARMVAMKSATDNADKMVKALTMQYNRARQSQITTELSEIMGGVEAMKGA